VQRLDQVKLGQGLGTHIDINLLWHQYVSMRTTIALDDDLAEKLQDLAHKRRSSFRNVVNETLRRGLSAQEPPEATAVPFEVDTFESAFRPGVDPLRLNQLLDDLEVEAITERPR
jgi:hypothetical protein